MINKKKQQKKQDAPLSWRASEQDKKNIEILAKNWGCSRNQAISRAIMLVRESYIK